MQRSHLGFAIILDSLAGGGAEKVMLVLAERLVALGHACTLLLLKPRVDYALPPGVEWRLMPVEGLWNRRARLTDWLDRLQLEKGLFDGFIINLDRSHRVMATLNLRNAVYVLHNDPSQSVRFRYWHPLKYWHHYQSLTALTGKKVIAVSAGVALGLQSISRVKPQSVDVIYNPLDSVALQQLARLADAEIPSSPYLIFVGRVARQKRLDRLFAALACLPQEVKLVCLTRNISKAYKLAKQYGVQSRVLLPGFKQNPYPWIQSARGLVLTSDFEGFGMVLAEALALSVPVVSTNCHYGPSELLTGDLAKWLVPLDDLEQLTHALRDLWDRPYRVGEVPVLAEMAPAKVLARYLRVLGVKAVADAAPVMCELSET